MTGLGLIAWAAPLIALLSGVLILVVFLRSKTPREDSDLGEDVLTQQLLDDLKEEE